MMADALSFTIGRIKMMNQKKKKKKKMMMMMMMMMMMKKRKRIEGNKEAGQGEFMWR